MSRIAIRASCAAFEVAVDEPRRGDTELRVEVVFAPDGPADLGTVELRLFARRRGIIRKESRWDTETAVAGTAARLERGDSGRLRFTRPLAPFVCAYSGAGLEIVPVLVVEGEDGSAVRLQLDIPTVAADASLVIRGLPLSEPLSGGIVGRLRRGPRPVATLEEAGAGAVAVAVREAPELVGGRVSLAAHEFERSEGHRSDWDPAIVSVDAALVPSGEEGLRAQLKLPVAQAAPASIACSRGTETQGIRWLARFELADARGRILRSELPVHVGVVRG